MAPIKPPERNSLRRDSRSVSNLSARGRQGQAKGGAAAGKRKTLTKGSPNNTKKAESKHMTAMRQSVAY